MSADTLPAAPPAMGSAEWFRVFTPDPNFNGTRYGQPFRNGEAVVHKDTKIRYSSKGATTVERDLLTLFVEECEYRIEAVPPGVPPVPRYIADKQGVAE